MTPYGYADTRTMALQKEALRRVRDMQQRARQSVEQSGTPEKMPEQGFQGKAARQPAGGQSPPESQRSAGFPPPPLQGAGGLPRGIAELLRMRGIDASAGGLGEVLHSTISSASKPVSDLLESFGIDGEKLIILMVMWAVFNEHPEDKTLLLALGYLLL